MKIMDMIRSATGIKPVLTEEELLAKIDELRNVAASITKTVSDSLATDPRWCAVAKTDLQRGIMALERAVNKPDKF